MAINPDANKLWQFSLKLYPLIKTICLNWQDSIGANVNMVLFLCYLEQQQLSLNLSQLNELSRRLDVFSGGFTIPLRTLRQSCHQANLTDTQKSQVKQALLQAELVLEQTEQQLLIQQCPTLIAKHKLLIEDYLAILDNKGCHQQQLVDIRQALLDIG